MEDELCHDVLTRALTNKSAFHLLLVLVAVAVVGPCALLGVILICVPAATWMLPAAVVGSGIGVRAIRRRG